MKEQVTVTITTTTVGQCFACMATIRDARTKEILARTRDFPYGMRSNAYAAAEEIARWRGWEIV